MVNFRLSFVLLCVYAMMLPFFGQSESSSDRPFRLLDEGFVHGSYLQSRSGVKFEAYYGLRYAHAPVGENRWRSSITYNVRFDYKDASEPGPVCPQFNKSKMIGEEDCLTLNVYRPKRETVTQVCARILGIDVNSISVKPSYSLTTPNNFVSAADTPTLVVCYAAQPSCLILLERLKPNRTSDSMPRNKVIAAANMDQVDLCIEYIFSTKGESPLKNHSIHGVTVTEVEVDLLTGQQEIQQVDLLIDCGGSMNLELDMDQAHGAFIIGLGYWLIEKLIYDESTRKRLRDITWDYKPEDTIPIDFRIVFRKNSPNPRTENL